MELILALLTYLTATLSPLEFIALSALVVAVSFFAVKWAVKNKNSIRSLLGRGNSELDDIKEQIELLATKEDLTNSFSKLEFILKHEISETDKSVEALSDKFVDISNVRHESIGKEFDELRGALIELSHHHAKMMSSIGATTVAQAKLMVQFENIDSSFKAGIIEFRNYHRDLSHNLKALERDLALIERSFDLKINNGSAVTLR